ncbi:MAG: hypothetical protein JSU07_08075 [Bacteroidetes bacterium]|nr:hypothetical protein [Bacteroidota bacterium]
MLLHDEAIFYEKQKFNQWWHKLLLIVINGIFVFSVVRQVIFNIPSGGSEGLFVSAATVLIISIFILSTKLETIVKHNGIYTRFFPFHFKFKYFSWNSLTACYIREYAPIMEYGGWGLRYGVFGNGKAYNVSGNKGLQLKFVTDKKLLIGTQKPEELEKALKNIKQNNNNVKDI